MFSNFFYITFFYMSAYLCSLQIKLLGKDVQLTEVTIRGIFSYFICSHELSGKRYKHEMNIKTLTQKGFNYEAYSRFSLFVEPTRVNPLAR